MTSPIPMRGQVWVCAFPRPIGPRPAVILTNNQYSVKLSAVTVALITDTTDPGIAHVPIGKAAKVNEYRESYANCTEIYTIRKPQLRRHIGHLSDGELRAVAQRIVVSLGLEDTDI